MTLITGEQNRVFIIDDKQFGFKRVNVLLKSVDCINSGRCIFCSYWMDNSNNLYEIKNINSNTIKSYKPINEPNIVSISPSASIFELPFQTLQEIKDKDWGDKVEFYLTEAHYHYRKLIPVFNDFMEREWRVKIGIETFNDDIRKQMGKDFELDLRDLKRHTDCINILSGFKFQNKTDILEDLKIAAENFKYVDWNILDTKMMPINKTKYADEELIKWCISIVPEIISKYPHIKAWLNASDYVEGD